MEDDYGRLRKPPRVIKSEQERANSTFIPDRGTNFQILSPYSMINQEKNRIKCEFLSSEALIGGFDYIDYSTNISTPSRILRLVTSPRDLVHKSLQYL